MKLKDLVKEIRIQNGYSLSAFGEYLDFSRGFLHNVEKGERKVSKRLLDKLVKKFPLYSNQLIETYATEMIPGIMERDSEIVEKAEVHEVKVYTFDSTGNGKVDLDNYKKTLFPLDADDEEIIMKNGFVFEIVGDNMQPYFSSSDIIVLTKEKFESWQSLDSRLILVEINGEYFIKKLFFITGEPYLYSFNERLYPELKVDEQTKFVAILYSQIVRHVDDLQFMLNFK